VCLGVCVWGGGGATSMRESGLLAGEAHKGGDWCGGGLGQCLETPARSPRSHKLPPHKPRTRHEQPHPSLPAGAEGPKVDVPTAGYLTARTLMRTVPAAVPGVMFLSGERGSQLLRGLCSGAIAAPLPAMATPRMGFWGIPPPPPPSLSSTCLVSSSCLPPPQAGSPRRRPPPTWLP
jgi:hypothetical protein